MASDHHSTEDLAEAANAQYGLALRSDEIVFGKHNHLGGLQVFGGSYYLGYLRNGQFIMDRGGRRALDR